MIVMWAMALSAERQAVARQDLWDSRSQAWAMLSTMEEQAVRVRENPTSAVDRAERVRDYPQMVMQEIQTQVRPVGLHLPLLFHLAEHSLAARAEHTTPFKRITAKEVVVAVVNTLAERMELVAMVWCVSPTKLLSTR